MTPRTWSWWVGAALLLAVAVVIVAGADTRPSYDAYGWLVWGRQTLHGALDTNAAPSFKPLPYVFTVVFALFGGAQMRLWLVFSVAVSLGGLVFAGRLAWRLAGGRVAGAVAGVLAVVGVLCLHDEFPYGYLHYVLSAQSDPMIVALLLTAIDCVLCGRRRWAFVALVLASLGRPEAWPFLLVCAAWLWREERSFRWALVAGVLVVGLLWFGVPALTSRSWLIAADNADASGFGPRGNKALGVLSRFVIQAPWPLSVAATLAVAWAAWRRDRMVVSLAGCVVVWMAVEVGFGLHGWPALGRYMFEASAVVVVLGAGCVGRLLSIARAGVGNDPGRGDAVAVAAGALAVAIVAGTIVIAVGQGRDARDDIVRQKARTASISRLTALVGRLGGPARVRACGESISDGARGDGLGTQTVLAYTVGRNVNAVGYKFPQPGHPDNPIVVFRPVRGGGWSARASRQVVAGCRALESRGRVVVR